MPPPSETRRSPNGCNPRTPTSSTPHGRTSARRARRRRSGPIGSRRTRGTSKRRGSSPARGTGWAGTRPRLSERRCSKQESRRAGPLSRSSPIVPRAISGLRPTWARSPSRSARARASSIAATSRTSSCSSSRLDPAFQQGSADRALGRWYFKVPGLFGGSNKKSEEHLRKSLTYNPNSSSSHFFLAETLIDMGRTARSAIRTAEGHRWSNRSRLGPGRSRVQRESAPPPRHSQIGHFCTNSAAAVHFCSLITPFVTNSCRVAAARVSSGDSARIQAFLRRRNCAPGGRKPDAKNDVSRSCRVESVRV